MQANNKCILRNFFSNECDAVTCNFYNTRWTYNDNDEISDTKPFRAKKL